MKPEDGFSHAFIDLARMGRTDWKSVVLTFLLVKFMGIAIAGFSLIFLEHPLAHIPDADKTVLFGLVDASACIFGFWLACKKKLRRPFLSLISIDMTFDIRRCLLGAAWYLPANAVGLMAMSLYASIRAGAWLVPFQHFEWPHHNDQLIASIGMLFVMPFLAFSEELLFRGWLTQTLGHYIRFPIIVVVSVAVLFAATHTQYDLRLKMLMMVCSLGLSALSLRDQRLELAIGAHSMMNVCATLQSLFFTGPLPPTHTSVTTLDLWILVILKGAVPFALMYGLLQKTRGWFTPSEANRLNSGNVLARPL